MKKMKKRSQETRNENIEKEINKPCDKTAEFDEKINKLCYIIVGTCMYICKVKYLSYGNIFLVI